MACEAVRRGFGAPPRHLHVGAPQARPGLRHRHGHVSPAAAVTARGALVFAERSLTGRLSLSLSFCLFLFPSPSPGVWGGHCVRGTAPTWVPCSVAEVHAPIHRLIARPHGKEGRPVRVPEAETATVPGAECP